MTDETLKTINEYLKEPGLHPIGAYTLGMVCALGGDDLPTSALAIAVGCKTLKESQDFSEMVRLFCGEKP